MRALNHVTSRPHPLWHRLGGLAIIAATVAWLGLAARAVSLLPTDDSAARGLVAVAALVGWGLADLVSGLFHYWADELANERTPWLGRNIIVPFREHHTDPLAMTRHSASETNGDNALAALPLLAGYGLLGPSTPSLLHAALAAGVLGFGGAVLLTNQIHKWAHVRNAPRAVRFLQRQGVLLSPLRHAQHHRAHDRAYCITAGWWNGLLDRMLTRPRRTSPPRHAAAAQRPPRSTS